jgi:hypothetical protein
MEVFNLLNVVLCICVYPRDIAVVHLFMTYRCLSDFFFVLLLLLYACTKITFSAQDESLETF